jgi:hypothetical protein
MSRTGTRNRHWYARSGALSIRHAENDNVGNSVMQVAQDVTRVSYAFCRLEYLVRPYNHQPRYLG